MRCAAPPLSSGSELMAVLRSTLFAILFYLGSATIVPLGAVLRLVWGPRVAGGARLWARWFWVLLPVLGIRVVVRGEIPQHAVMVASKHQSACETIATLYLWNH